jgi:hypothetical protein
LLFNSLAILHGRFSATWNDVPRRNPFVEIVEGQIRYPIHTLALCAMIVAGLLWYLVRQPKGECRQLAEHLDGPLLNGPIMASRS